MPMSEPRNPWPSFRYAGPCNRTVIFNYDTRELCRASHYSERSALFMEALAVSCPQAPTQVWKRRLGYCCITPHTHEDQAG